MPLTPPAQAACPPTAAPSAFLRVLSDLCVCLCLFVLPSTLQAETPEHLLNRGHADEAIAALQKLTATNPKDGDSHLLLCRAFYAKQFPDEAVAECESALQTLSTSTAQDWMGRAYGLKADRSGPITGLRLAPKVRMAFEEAVHLNPRDNAAVNDLGEYYASAPSMVGGGTDKARDLATSSLAALPQAAHRLRALAAEKDHDYPTAEGEFRLAVGVAGRADAWADLADFYGRRSQPGPMLDALQKSVAANHTGNSSLVDCADILVTHHKAHPELAEKWLRAYLDGNAQTDDAPTFKALTSLAKILSARGDKANARMELSKALALASNYGPAQKVLNSL